MSANPAILMPQLSPPALCVSIHDVAPATWPLCERLLKLVAAVAPMHVSLLLVPDYHRMGDDTPAAYRAAIEACHERGHELVLHGHVHLDDGPPPRTPAEWWRRRVLTADEGEFAALDAAPAHARLLSGWRWFARHNWPVEGFVAPAWLLGPGGWRALGASPFRYTVTATHFHLLHPHTAVSMPVVAYSTRSAVRRALSLAWQGSRRLPSASPVQLALHPADARYPSVMKQAQYLLEKLLADRVALTQREYARLLELAVSPPRLERRPMPAPRAAALHRL